MLVCTNCTGCDYIYSKSFREGAVAASPKHSEKTHKGRSKKLPTAVNNLHCCRHISLDACCMGTPAGFRDASNCFMGTGWHFHDEEII